MKKIFIIPCLLVTIYTHAQFVIQGNNAMTIQSYALVSIDGLIVSPGSDLTLSDNELIKSSTSEPINSGNTIERVYSFTNPITYSGTLGFRYQDAELAGNDEESLNIITSETGGGNVWITMESGSIYTEDNIITTSVINTTLSRVTAINGEVLPLKLLSFTAKCDNENAILNWSTSNEEDIASFTIQHSNDTRKWDDIKNIKFKEGNHQYAYTTRNENRFYRLKINNSNQSAQYSDILKTDCGTTGNYINIGPNPATDFINIKLENVLEGDLYVQVLDSKGALINTFVWTMVKGSNIYNINTSGFASGMYYIKLYNENNTINKTAKVVKK